MIWTSKWRWPRVRVAASRQAANDSGSRSSRLSPSANRALNRSVSSRSSASESRSKSSARALTWSVRPESFLMMRPSPARNSRSTIFGTQALPSRRHQPVSLALTRLSHGTQARRRTRVDRPRRLVRCADARPRTATPHYPANARAAARVPPTGAGRGRRAGPRLAARGGLRGPAAADARPRPGPLGPAALRPARGRPGRRPRVQAGDRAGPVRGRPALVVRRRLRCVRAPAGRRRLPSGPAGPGDRRRGLRDAAGGPRRAGSPARRCGC